MPNIHGVERGNPCETPAKRALRNAPLRFIGSSVTLETAMKSRVLKFTVVFEKAEEGGYIAHVPALPGCVTQGETLEEAEKMARDAIRAYCASLKKHGEPIPAEVNEVVESLLVTVPA